MANSLMLREKPANAKYIAKAVVNPTGDVQMTSPETELGEMMSHFEQVEVAWYPDRVKITLKGGTPASITQAYLTGKDQDVIIEIAEAPAK